MVVTTPTHIDQRERRYTPAGRSNLRMVNGNNGKSKTLVGHAALFDVLSVDLGGYREKIRLGAFAKSLKRGDDVAALIEHTTGIMVLGRTTAGTLKLEEDHTGLRAEIALPDTNAGRDLITLIGRGDISQMSFAFTVRKQEWSEPKGGDPIRTLLEVDLHDVSPVVFPAYTNTTVGIRALTQWRNGGGKHVGSELEFQRRRLAAFDTALL